MGRGGLERGSGAHYNYSFIHHAGAFRKPVDQIGGSRLCLTRVWVFVVTLTSIFLLASVTPWGNSIQAKIFYPKSLAFSNPRGSESAPQLLWERRTEQMFAFSFIHQKGGEQKNGVVASSKNRPRSLTSHISETLAKPSPPNEQRSEAAAESTPFIEDIVALPEDLDVFIVQHGSSFLEERISACRYGAGDLKSVPRMVDFLSDRRLAVTCIRPFSLRTQETLEVEEVSLELDGGVGSTPLLPSPDGTLMPTRWDEALVYAAQLTDMDVILYVKNLFSVSRRKVTDYTELENFRCRFGEAVETPVRAAAQEVFRCEYPSLNRPTTFGARVKVYLLYKGRTIPSVAYYEPIQGEHTLPAQIVAANENLENTFSSEVGVTTPKKKHLVCSCTMIWNVAKFLKEWVLYNSDLGVEKFFLYDNNSEDDIRNAVSELSEYNVTRKLWPWVKTQEAGFSHCAIEAQRECTWVLFTDVDEYLFPKRWLGLTEETQSGGENAAAKEASPLASLIEDTLTRVALPAVSNGSKGTLLASMKPALPLQVGQISFLCRNFGPSGKTTNPSDGVTQGYTCRDKRELRHKSLVYFPALKSSLQNVIHHFSLKPDYQTVYLDVRHAVVNHFKFQAWSEFETKFRKRASTYVVDWKEPKNLNSKDRPEGLGPEPTKPPNWETSHCDMNDTSLRDYTRRRYGVLGKGDSVKMVWEL